MNAVLNPVKRHTESVNNGVCMWEPGTKAAVAKRAQSSRPASRVRTHLQVLASPLPVSMATSSLASRPPPFPLHKKCLKCSLQVSGKLRSGMVDLLLEISLLKIIFKFYLKCSYRGREGKSCLPLLACCLNGCRRQEPQLGLPEGSRLPAGCRHPMWVSLPFLMLHF